MELTLKITDPADLSKFATLLSSLFPTGAPIAITTPVARPIATKPSGVQPQQIEPQVTESAAVSEAAEPIAETSVPTTSSDEIAPADMRTLAQSKIQADKANQAKVKAIVEELGGTSISTVPEERRAEFMEQIKAL